MKKIIAYILGGIFAFVCLSSVITTFYVIPVLSYYEVTKSLVPFQIVLIINTLIVFVALGIWGLSHLIEYLTK